MHPVEPDYDKPAYVQISEKTRQKGQVRD